MKTIWIVSGGVEAVPGIRRAKEMGLHVVVSDQNPKAPGFDYADDKIIASTYDVEETVEAAVNYHKKVRPIDGVICVASDVPLTVARIAEKLSLTGISTETAKLTTDKYLMKECLADQGITVPWFSYINTLNELFNIINKRGFPLVIKPVDSRGARGVLRLVEGTDLSWAYQLAKNNSLKKKVLVEEFVNGPQISSEAILINGIGYTIGFSDRNYEHLERFSPYFIENGGSQPSVLSLKEHNDVAELAVRAGKALGVKTGVVKGDMVLSDRGPMVIEIAPRLSGGWFCTDQIPLHTGVDIIDVAIKLALGETVTPEELIPRFKQAVAIRYFFPPAGYVQKMPNLHKLHEMPGVHKIILFLKEGDRLDSVTNHTQRAGCVITCGDSRDIAIKRATDVVRKAEAGFIIKDKLE